MRVAAVRPGRAVACAAVLMAVGGCSRGPEVETTLVFDGERGAIRTDDVSCTRGDGVVVIFVNGPGKQMFRAVVIERGRLVAERVALRYDDVAGFIADPAEVEVSRVDDTYRFRGRMPPDVGEATWHTFQIETKCPSPDGGEPATRARGE